MKVSKNPLRWRRLTVNVVDTDASTPNALELAASLNDLLGDSGTRTDNKAVVLRDHFEQLIGLRSLLQLYQLVLTATKDLTADLLDGVCCENARIRWGSCAEAALLRQ
jgi:hypothetical protein